MKSGFIEMDDIFNKISELERLGEFEKILELTQNEMKTSIDKKSKLKLNIAQQEANYNLRNFQAAKKNVEDLLLDSSIAMFPNFIGDAHNLLGKIFRIHQRYEEALNHYKSAESAYKQVQNNSGLAKIYLNIGNAYIFLQDIKTAKKFHMKSLELALITKNERLIANCHLNLGSLHYQNGEVESALDNFKKALEIFNIINDIPALAAVHLNIAESLFLRRNFTESSKYSAVAIELYGKQNNILGQNIALKSFAKSEKHSGNFKNAIKSFEEVLKNQESAADEEILLELGECYLELKNIEKAEELFFLLQNNHVFSPQARGYALNSLALLAGEKKEFTNSINYYQELLEVLEDLPVEDNDSKASTLGNLGFMHLKLDNSEEAFRYLNSSLKYFEKNKIWEESIVLLNNYFTEFLSKKKYDKGLSLIEEFSLPIAKKAKSGRWRDSLHLNVAFLYHLVGNSTKGTRYCKKYLSDDLLGKSKPNFITNEILPSIQRNELEDEWQVFTKLLTQ